MSESIIYFYSRCNLWFEFSNYFYSPMQIDGKWYPTVEHWFQSAKALDEKDREFIRKCKSPAEAKRCGKVVKLRPDWEQVKDDIMYKGLKAKFTQNKNLRDMLLSTGISTLKEKSPTDIYWGYLGKNMLGILLMKLRDELYDS